ncbi:5-carboxymethyl-2-hydroxymuconate Delta-isomerase [Flagellimonas sp.]|uniref:5-carboxymethyl-2-hydroxymuconate Delta-isomerase n=1 Tax=Flagellimonas sp. TaxID=2058762 RepID=UPI003B520A4D
MPHLVIECSERILKRKAPDQVIQTVYNTVISTDGFSNNVMVRIIPFKHFITMGSNDDFIYICAHILEGRTTEQKKELSTKVITQLKEMFPELSKISMTFREFDKATFTNNSMV